MDKWIVDIVEEYAGDSLHWKVGDVVKRPNGQEVQITRGSYWGTYGVSNHWSWRVVNPDGSLGEAQHGYGWQS